MHRIVAGLFAFATLFMSPPPTLAGPFDDTLVQPPELEAPGRASVAGTLAGWSLGPADVRRGGFALTAPLEFPAERGALGASLAPSYSVDGGLSEWGQGWATALEIRRHRLLGDLDFTTDGFTSPWGELVRGDDGAYYVRGLAASVRATLDDSAWTVVAANGDRFRFRAADAIDTTSGRYAWVLGEVETLDGERTELLWNKNASGRPFLVEVRWGARGVSGEALPYAVQLAYERLATPFHDHRSGRRVTLDRRVIALRQYARHRETGARTLRWTWRLGYEPSPSGPAFYLSEVSRSFASGEVEPATRYTYQLAAASGGAGPMPLPELDGLLAAWGSDALAGEHAAFVDLDDDGQTEVEHAPSMTTWWRASDGQWQATELAPATGAEDLRCRRAPGLANPPRSFVRLGGPLAPWRIVAARAGGAETDFVVCDVDGRPLGESSLPGQWEPGPLTRLSDVNKDHRPDLVRLGIGVVDVWRATGDDDHLELQATERQALSPRFAAESAWILDVDGDGMVDLVGRGRNVLVVWSGLGGGRFEPAGRRYGLRSRDGRRLTDLTRLDFTWIDANEDGLLDLVAIDGSAINLHVNDGWDFMWRAAPALAGLGGRPGLPLAADLSGSGERELVLLDRRHAYTVALSTPGMGLLAAIDDGRGARVDLAWKRAEAVPGLGSRPPLLATLTSSAVGTAPVTWSYEYETPRVHSQAGHLLGYELTLRLSTLGSESLESLIDDDVSVTLSTAHTDERSPSMFAFSRHGYVETSFAGLRRLRATTTESGFRRYDGTSDAVTRDEVLAEAAPGCVTQSRRERGADALMRTIELAPAPVGVPAALACLPGRTTQQGLHADPTRDFVHLVAVDRDSLGRPTRIRREGAQGARVLETIVYDANGRVVRIDDPGKGSMSFDWAGDGSNLLVAVHAADGTTRRVERDPVADVVVELVVDRGDAAAVERFAYDGRERLARRWNELDPSSFAEPLEEFAYVEPTAEGLGVVRARSLLEPGASWAEAATIFDGAGQEVATLARAPRGWTVSGLSRVDRATRVTERFVQPHSIALAGGPVATATLFTGAHRVAETRAGAFIEHADATTAVASGVTLERREIVELVAGELVLTTYEAGRLRGRVGHDAAGRVRWREDALGGRTTLEHDALDRLISVRLPDGARQRVELDDEGRPAVLHRDGVGETRFGYDATTGQLREERIRGTDGLTERVVEHAYDHAGRLTASTSFQLRRGSVAVLRRQYDGVIDGTVVEPGQRGLATRVTGDGWERRVSYRADGRVLARELVLAGWRRIHEAPTYAADGSELGRVIRVFDMDDREVGSHALYWQLDETGRRDRLWIDGEAVLRLSYADDGLPVAAALESGDVYTWLRDPETRRVTGRQQSGSFGVREATTSWDERGLVTEEAFVDEAGASKRRYDYDARQFLTSVDDLMSGDSERYAYDPAGLLVGIDDRRGARSLLGGGLEDAGYAADALGRIVRRGDLELVYGPRGHIDEARRGADTWSYLYDEADQRLARVEGGKIVEAWVAGGHLDDQGLSLPVEIDGRLVGIVGAGGFVPRFTDSRGTPIGQGRALPSAFGDTEVRGPEAAWLDFTGEAYDARLGVMRLGVRDYDPVLGRFWTPDPKYLAELESCASSPTDCTLYAYARNNPVSLVDRTGLDPSSDDSAGTGWLNRARGTLANAWKEFAPSFLRGRYDYTTSNPVGVANGSGYTRLGPMGPQAPTPFDIPLGVSPEEAMSVLQRNPDKIFPFRVVPTDGGDATIRLGGVYDLNGPRTLGIAGDKGNGVKVIEVSPTSFTFETLASHFDGPGATIRFTTENRGGTVYLQQEGHAPSAGVFNALVAPIGARLTSWPIQADSLRRALVDARRAAPSAP